EHAQPSQLHHPGAHRPGAGGGAADPVRRVRGAPHGVHHLPGRRLFGPVGRAPGPLPQPDHGLRQADGPAGRQAAAGGHLPPLLPALARVGAGHALPLVRRRAPGVGAGGDLWARAVHHPVPRLRGEAGGGAGGGERGEAEGRLPEHLRGRGHLLVRAALGRARAGVGGDAHLGRDVGALPPLVHHRDAGGGGGPDGLLAGRVPEHLPVAQPGPAGDAV
ncbi:MAG: CDP-diacylglycerol--glycerol-3-phosphate 3-phosphatidyltransferase, partial [uncultured Gemmatimonadetes bacterium]